MQIIVNVKDYVKDEKEIKLYSTVCRNKSLDGETTVCYLNVRFAKCAPLEISSKITIIDGMFSCYKNERTQKVEPVLLIFDYDIVTEYQPIAKPEAIVNAGEQAKASPIVYDDLPF